ncbi:ABC transporter ATP-binding protein [uncultured Jatrophihabitans sp.]|uniref:ABC transporter ATP-binding protein n=1 Tax=uncultured Jatrophihabitans sp. TaxID=1610747 RepID=UPI0035CBE225
MTVPALSIEDLRLTVRGPKSDANVLLGVDLEVGRGESVGLVGESGSGKSMTLRAITALAPPGSQVSGSIRVAGTDALAARGRALRRLRGREVGLIFQDPRSAINPTRRIGDFLLEASRDAGEDLAATRVRAVELLHGMGIADAERRMSQYPFELSGGLLQRIMIASVLLPRPTLILADEPTTALDVTTQSDVLLLTDDLRRAQGTAMVFVTHDLDLALAVCSQVAVMYAGMIVEIGPAQELRRQPRHPYTIGLLASRPPLDRRLGRIPAIPGIPLAAASFTSGCPFLARCPIRIERCQRELPALTSTAIGRARCHRSAEIASGSVSIDFSATGSAAVLGDAQ